MYVANLHVFFFNPWAQPVGGQCFFLCFVFPCLGVSSLLFCSWVIGFLSCFFFTTEESASFRLTLFLTLGEFQAWDWLWYPLNFK